MRRICVQHTAILTSRIRGRGVPDVAIVARLGATGEPGEGELCPFHERNIPNRVVQEMGDSMGDTMAHPVGSQQVQVRAK